MTFLQIYKDKNAAKIRDSSRQNGWAYVSRQRARNVLVSGVTVTCAFKLTARSFLSELRISFCRNKSNAEISRSFGLHTSFWSHKQAAVDLHNVKTHETCVLILRYKPILFFVNTSLKY